MGESKQMAPLSNTPKRVQSFLNRYPLTLLGTALAAISIYLFIAGLADENPFALVLGAIGLIMTAAALIGGYAIGKNVRRSVPEWDSGLPLHARADGETRFSTNYPLVLPPLFRIHARVSGILETSRRGRMFISEEAASREGAVSVIMQIPVCGILKANARLSIRDTIGLANVQISEPETRDLHIKPAITPDAKLPLFVAREGEETKSRREQSDVERYFMREYVPGDRYRDINWKASSKTNDLYTRISPKTEEKSHVVTLLFRPFVPPGAETADSIAHVDFLKSWFMLLIRFIKQQRPETEFEIFTGESQYRLETPEEIDLFGQVICSLAYEAPGSPIPLNFNQESDGAVFIFSTHYDSTLGACIQTFSGRTVYLFATASAKDGDEERREIRILSKARSVKAPGGWAVKHDKKDRIYGIPTPRDGKAFIERLDVRIL